MSKDKEHLVCSIIELQDELKKSESSVAYLKKIILHKQIELCRRCHGSGFYHRGEHGTIYTKCTCGYVI